MLLFVLGNAGGDLATWVGLGALEDLSKCKAALSSHRRRVVAAGEGSLCDGGNREEEGRCLEVHHSC